jgi:hypothetical protein
MRKNPRAHVALCHFALAYHLQISGTRVARRRSARLDVEAALLSMTDEE